MRANALAILAVALSATTVSPASPDSAHDSRRTPLWDVSGRWDGANGAEYAVFQQRGNGALGITIHHTCAPRHIERGQGRITGDRVTGRVEPVDPPPPGCARFATIDVRVDPKGMRMSGRYATDLGAGELLYIGKRRARSLVRFKPRIVRNMQSTGRVDLQVLLRAQPHLPAGAAARVRLCGPRGCVVAKGRHGPRFIQPRRLCGSFEARVDFAGSSASVRRRLCVGPRMRAR